MLVRSSYRGCWGQLEEFGSGSQAAWLTDYFYDLGQLFDLSQPQFCLLTDNHKEQSSLIFRVRHELPKRKPIHKVITHVKCYNVTRDPEVTPLGPFLVNFSSTKVT